MMSAILNSMVPVCINVSTSAKIFINFFQQIGNYCAIIIFDNKRILDKNLKLNRGPNQTCTTKKFKYEIFKNL